MIRHVTRPRAELQSYIRNFMVGGFASVDNLLPANFSQQLVIYYKGSSYINTVHGGAWNVPVASLSGPSLAPYAFRMRPGSEFVVVTFRPAGLQACLGIPALASNEQLVPLSEFLPGYEVEQLQEQLGSSTSPQEIVGLLEDFLMRRMLCNAAPSLSLPELGLPHLLQPAENLARSFSLGKRQLERRFLQTYGMPLRDYRRLFRFSVALMHMMTTTRQAGALTRIAQDSSYVDQSHLIKDFKQFIGDTPSNFLKEFTQPHSIYNLWQFDQRELKMYAD